MYAVISSPGFYSEIEQTILSRGEEVLLKVVEKSVDIAEELEKVSRLSFKNLIIDLSIIEDQNVIIPALRKFRILNENVRIFVLAPNFKVGNPMIEIIVNMGIWDILNPQISENGEPSVVGTMLAEALNREKLYKRAVKWVTGEDPDNLLNAQTPSPSKKIGVAKATAGKGQEPESIDSTLRKNPKMLKDLIGDWTEEEQKKHGFLRVEERLITKKTNIVIAVAGTNHGVGCTQIAIHIANFFSRLKQGYNVAVLQMNKSNDFQIMSGYGLKKAKRENSFRYNNVDYYYETSLADLKLMNYYDVYILDLGVLKHFDFGGNLRLNTYYEYMYTSDISLLVCHSKPWQLKYIYTCLFNDTELLGQQDKEYVNSFYMHDIDQNTEMNNHWKLLFNLSDDDFYKEISEHLSRAWECYKVPYGPDMFIRYPEHDEMFNDILKAVLNPVLPTQEINVKDDRKKGLKSFLRGIRHEE